MAATQSFTSSVYPLTVFGVTVPGYAALYSVAINVLVVLLLTPLFDLVTKRRERLGAAIEVNRGCSPAKQRSTGH